MRFLCLLGHTDTPNYWQSYFTQAEILQWRRFRDQPLVYAANVDASGGGGISDPFELEPLDDNERKLWAKISIGINRRMQQFHHAVPFAGGKFARTCYMVACRNCGQHFLVSKKRMQLILENARVMWCPHCNAKNFQVSEGAKRGNLYRKPILIQQPERVSIRVLESNELLKLLLTNEPLPQFPVVTEENEKLWSDIATLGRIYVGLELVAGAALLLASFFKDSEE